MIRELGKMPDYVLAERIGVSRATIGRWRRQAGIAAYPRRVPPVDAVIRERGLTRAADVVAATGCTLKTAYRALERIRNPRPPAGSVEERRAKVVEVLRWRSATSREIAEAVFGLANERTVQIARRLARPVAVFSKASGVWRLR